MVSRPERRRLRLASGLGGFLDLASLDSSKESTFTTRNIANLMILRCFVEGQRRSGFQVDSPAKKPDAGKPGRSAPPYTDRTGEEPWEGAALD